MAHLPSGIAHDSRHTGHYLAYADHAAGPRKRDADGNCMVDCHCGHGVLPPGHRVPAVTAAAQAQLGRGTQFGSCHAPEIARSALVTQMVPGAERVRFISSGTEATHMALRLARAFTGRRRIIRFRRHSMAGTTTWPSASTTIPTARPRPACRPTSPPGSCCCRPATSPR